MDKLLLSLIAIIFIFLNGCSSAPEKNITKTNKEFQVIIGENFCYPVENDSFDHPIDSLPIIVTEDISIWPRIQSGLTLYGITHSTVKKNIKWYASHPNYLKRVQQRSARYLHAIIELLEKENLPTDLAFLPIVESAYEPFAYSHGQASGLWQFIPMTAKRFNLQGNWWRDDRRNTVKSTQAAIKYLTYLHRYFDNDWLLALAAYNAGEGTVRNAINRNKKRGLPTDFWHLKLPSETKSYVPKLIALSTIFNNPESYNIELQPIPNEPYFDSVLLDFQLDLAQAATLADTSIDELYYLNPDLNRWATPPVKAYQFKIPADKKSHFKKALASLPKGERINWYRHTVFKGDTLSDLANTYNSDIRLIKEINQLKGNKIVVGTTLMIPMAKGNAVKYTYSMSQRLSAQQNRRPGNQLYRYDYPVKSGDSFWKIAKKHNISITQLTRWNNKSPKDTLQLGEKLVIWKHKKQASRSATIRKITYKVRNGDSLAKISSKFNVRIKEIVEWNRINPKNYLFAGQRLKIYVDVTKSDY